MSQGRAPPHKQFDHYAEVPRAVAEKSQAKLRLIERRAKDPDGGPMGKEKFQRNKQHCNVGGRSVTSTTARRR